MTETKELAVDEALIPVPDVLPDGVVMRPGRRDDVPALTALLTAEETAVTGESAWSETEVAEWFEGARELARGITRTLELDGRLIGLWRVFRNFDAKYPSQVTIDRTLDPALLDELWRAGVEWVQRTALAVAATRGVAEPRVDLWVHDGDEGAQRHVEAAGFERARAFFEMHIDLAGYSPAPVPAGVTVRQCRIDGSASPDLAQMHRVISTSFQDHFDFEERPLDQWIESRVEDPLNDFSHWYLAEVDGEVVGGLTGHNGFVELADAGYVGVLGVLREGRGRGVAKALLHTSFARYQAEGRAAVKLHVDAESPTGATHLYESVGMYRRHVGYDYQKHLTGAAQTPQ